jgi:hypothetical protein
MHIAYAAHTASCTFLMDADGVCRWVIARPGATGEVLARAQRCVGAQYVASLDLGTAGGLVQLPQVGAALLFARSEDGRVVLVRTGTVTAFEAHSGDSPSPPERLDDLDGHGDACDDEPTLRRMRRSGVPPIPPPPRSHTRDSASAPTLRRVFPKRRARG